MKRVLLAVLLFVFALAFVGHAYAQEGVSGGDWSKQEFMNKMATAKVHQIQGTVVSHDPACHCVVIKTAKGELTLQDDYAKFMQDYNQAKGLKIGAKVTGTYKTVNHIHYLQDIGYAM
jgi:hypothetical protein